MSATPEAAETAGDAPATEGEAAAETEETTIETPVEGEAPAEGADPKVETKDGDKEPEPAKPLEIPEETLRKAALQHANKTMAAARRAEARVEAVKTENTALKQSVKVYEDFVTELQQNPGAAIRRAGFGSIKAFLDKVAEAGEGPKTPTAEDEIAALKREREQEKSDAAKAKAAAAVADAQSKVFAAIDADKARFARTATRRGHSELWEAIGEYHRMHGEVPDAAVYLLADQVERGLREEFGEPIPVQRQDATKTGASPGNAAAGGRTSGKTLTNKQTAGAPAVRELSLDPDERRKQVNDELRAEGLL